MIIEGCDILLDVNQMFVRQGTLIQVVGGHGGAGSGHGGHHQGHHGSKASSVVSRLPQALGGSRDKEKEAVRQCFLFSHHLIITTR